MKHVTYWSHPSESDSKLILEGTPEQTRTEASQYFENDPDGMTHTEGEMTDETFAALPEFEG